jgi:hypothetical protein
VFLGSFGLGLVGLGLGWERKLVAGSGVGGLGEKVSRVWGVRVRMEEDRVVRLCGCLSVTGVE